MKPLASGLRKEDAIVISEDDDEVPMENARKRRFDSQYFDNQAPEPGVWRGRWKQEDSASDAESDEDVEMDADVEMDTWGPVPGRVGQPYHMTGTDHDNLRVNQQCQPSWAGEPYAENEDSCPYYYDTKLGLKLYRGPGFKQFHPVLGSMEGHREVCAEWDARRLQKEKHNSQSPIVSRLRQHGDGGESSLANAFKDRADAVPFEGAQGFLPSHHKQEQYCLKEVLTIFPQIEHDFVRKLFRERHLGPHRNLVGAQPAGFHVPAAIIADIAEMESFPQQKDLKRKNATKALENEDVTIVWNKDVPKNETYYREALILLAGEFTRIPTHFINKSLREKGTLYDTFQYLAESENNFNNSAKRPYHRTKLGRITLEKKYRRTPAEQREGHQYVGIVNEFQAARQQQCREEMRQKRQKDDEEAEANNYKVHELQVSLVECQCCFSEAPINRVVHCENDEVHFFCNHCINTRAKEQIGAMKYEMKCMDTSGCGAELAREALSIALPVKISDKLAELQQLAEIKAAGLDGLEQCPFCDYQAICPSVEVAVFFECLNPSCEKVSCRKCHEQSHVPKTCEEARKDKGLSARHTIEEARSEAMIRACPKCKVKLIKSAGCNKMTCTNCNTVMCYVCKKDISGRNYEHFGSTTSTCPLHDQYADDRHKTEADEAERAAIAVAKAANADVNEEDLRVEAHLNPPPPPTATAATTLDQRNGRQGLMFGQRYHLGQGPAELPRPAAAPFPMYDFFRHEVAFADRAQDMVQDHEQQARRFLLGNQEMLRHRREGPPAQDLPRIFNPGWPPPVATAAAAGAGAVPPHPPPAAGATAGAAAAAAAAAAPPFHQIGGMYIPQPPFPIPTVNAAPMGQPQPQGYDGILEKDRLHNGFLDFQQNNVRYMLNAGGGGGGGGGDGDGDHGDDGGQQHGYPVPRFQRDAYPMYALPHLPQQPPAPAPALPRDRRPY